MGSLHHGSKEREGWRGYPWQSHKSLLLNFMVQKKTYLIYVGRGISVFHVARTGREMDTGEY